MRIDRRGGFTIIELLVVVAIIAVLTAIAAPSLLRARMQSNEASALSSLRTINLAQVAYASSCGNEGYAIAFSVLATPPAGSVEGFIPGDLAAAAPSKAGYAFVLGAGAGSTVGDTDCNGIATRTSYYLTAIPDWFGFTGSRSFATNQADIIWALNASAAPLEPFGSPAVTVG